MSANDMYGGTIRTRYSVIRIERRIENDKDIFMKRETLYEVSNNFYDANLFLAEILGRVIYTEDHPWYSRKDIRKELGVYGVDIKDQKILKEICDRVSEILAERNFVKVQSDEDENVYYLYGIEGKIQCWSPACKEWV